MLVGVCAPHASKEWHQQDITSSIEEDENNIVNKNNPFYGLSNCDLSIGVILF